MGRFGRLLFSLAIIGIGVETLICSYLSDHKVVPVIPWLPAIPGLTYLVGAILVMCGAALLLRRTLVVSSITLGALMLLCGLAFDLPRRPNLMSAEWRTNVLEPIAIGSLAWLAPGLGGIPRWLHRASRYLLAFALIVFGIAHFQVLTFIASMFSGSHLHCQHGARLDSVALVLDCFLRRRLHSRGRKLRHWISATMGGFRYGTDVRALDGNNSPTARSQLFPHPRRNSRSGQVVGRLHCRSAMGRLLGAVAR